YFPEALEHQGLDPEIRKSLTSLLDQLKAEGHTVEPKSFHLLEYVVPTYYILTTAEASSNLSRYDGIKYGFRSKGNHSDLTELYKSTRSEGFSWEVKRRIMLGTFVLSSGYYDAYFTSAQKVRNLLFQQIQLI